ncbi:hypothetical protein JCM17961_08880 [Endothiovibrio diazotrophicus]
MGSLGYRLQPKSDVTDRYHPKRQATTHRPEPLRGLLGGAANELSQLVARAGRLERLRQRLKGRLPAELSGHCRLANIRGDTAVVSCDSAAWGARLRYLEPQLLDALNRQEGLSLRRVRVKVLPHTAPPPPPPVPGHLPQLNEANADLLEATARGIADAGLSAALRRLARRGRKS